MSGPETKMITCVLPGFAEKHKRSNAEIIEKKKRNYYPMLSMRIFLKMWRVNLHLKMIATSKNLLWGQRFNLYSCSIAFKTWGFCISCTQLPFQSCVYAEGKVNWAPPSSHFEEGKRSTQRILVVACPPQDEKQTAVTVTN